MSSYQYGQWGAVKRFGRSGNGVCKGPIMNNLSSRWGKDKKGAKVEERSRRHKDRWGGGVIWLRRFVVLHLALAWVSRYETRSWEYGVTTNRA